MATNANNLPKSGPRSGLKPATVESLGSVLVLVLVVGLLVAGWTNRDALGVRPEDGFGYALGIIGGSMMLILLGYPLRKRIKPRRKSLGSVGFWFRFHMLLGLLGPTAVLFHSRFTFAALNSAMALGSMIIVASSGLIGRFFYSRVHRGFSDRKLELRALKSEMDDLIGELAAGAHLQENVRAQLEKLEADAIGAGRAFWTSAGAVISLSVRSRVVERQLRAQVAAASPHETSLLRAKLSHFFDAVRRSAEFAFYDRLLRLWHLFHLPLFYMMVAAVILHIVAVHMY